MGMGGVPATCLAPYIGKTHPSHSMMPHLNPPPLHFPAPLQEHPLQASAAAAPAQATTAHYPTVAPMASQQQGGSAGEARGMDVQGRSSGLMVQPLKGPPPGPDLAPAGEAQHAQASCWCLKRMPSRSECKGICHLLCVAQKRWQMFLHAWHVNPMTGTAAVHVKADMHLLPLW